MGIALHATLEPNIMERTVFAIWVTSELGINVRNATLPAVVAQDLNQISACPAQMSL